MLPEYSRVRVVTDKYAKDGVPEGTTGYVIEVYDDGSYEVEFSDPETGSTFAQLVIAHEHVTASGGPECATARSGGCGKRLAGFAERSEREVELWLTSEESLDELMKVSPRLRKSQAVLAEEWAPELPPPTLVSSELARALLALADTMTDEEIQAVFAGIERVLSVGEAAAKDVVATGFLEVLVAASDRDSAVAARVVRFLGPRAAAYCEAWKAHT